MVYVLDELTGVTKELLEQLSLRASPQRREYAARYRFEKDRIQSIFSFLLLQHGIKEEYGETRELILDYGGGKPVLTGLEQIQFNLSHCQLAVACGLSDRPIGVDVQNWDPRHLAVAKQVCSPRELVLLQQVAEPDIAFSRLWTRKESYGKFTGQGILYPMHECDLWENSPPGTVMETVTFQGYALSYCGETASKIQKVTIHDLL